MEYYISPLIIMMKKIFLIMMKNIFSKETLLIQKQIDYMKLIVYYGNQKMLI